jgi:CheY-like chemotaxis protein/signal transduction histidine kinase/CHASE3 domain sensor protein
VNEVEDRKLLARRLAIALATPIVLLLALGLAFSWQIVRMTSDYWWLDHTDLVLSVLSDTERQVVDQEAAVRGSLLTKDPSFRDLYEADHPLIGFARLRDLVSDNLTQQARIDETRRRYEEWEQIGRSAIDRPEALKGQELVFVRERAERMRAIRALLQDAVSLEQSLRRERMMTSESSATTFKILLVVLLGGAAAVLSFLSRTQLRAIADTFGTALEAEKKSRHDLETEAWVRAGHAKASDALTGELSLDQLGAACLSMLVPYVKADVAAFFTNEAGVWKRHGAFALESGEGTPSFRDGEGIVGRVARDKRLVHMKEVPAGYLRVKSATGEATPAEVVVVPASADGIPRAVLEFGFLRAPTAAAVDLLGRIGETVGLAVRSSEYQQRLRELLEQSQRQTEELQTQQEELRVANEELEEQGNAMRDAQRLLEERQHELETTNVRLEEQANELMTSRQEIAAKAADLARTSRYKSEFVANMSHELRTPLNSTLILAKLLSENKEGNLTAEQVKFGEMIYAAGNDLLALIGDILDLSKIESGKLELDVAPVEITRLRDSLARTFQPLATQKKIELSFSAEPGTPTSLQSDAQRIEQVLKNLLANAIKFTEKGRVSLHIVPVGDKLEFRVEDTGIGISVDHQEAIFEAFRQADGSTNRKYGGTGLGLSISRELAHLLGGELTVESEPGKGSVFTLALPLAFPARSNAPPPREAAPRPVPARRARAVETRQLPATVVSDDRGALNREKRLVLIVEDDPAFAKIVVDLVHEMSFQAIVADLAEDGIELARTHQPSAIILDINLPDHSGLSVLDRLKRDPVTRHIPIHVVSGDDYAQTVLQMGAVGYLLKPVKREELAGALKKLEARFSNRMRRLLIVEDDAVQRKSLEHLLGAPDVEITTCGTAADALALFQANSFDVVVADLTLPDASGFDLLETMAADEAHAFPPVIVYTGRSLDAAEEVRLRRHSTSIIVKGARSPERLLDEVSLFLHQVEAELPPEQQRMLRKARDREAAFEGKTILVVEDDARNIFALSSILEPKGAHVVVARNGREGLAALHKTPNVSLVLMDIMMPEMDGLEATRAIRADGRWAKLPVIALTAKAMKDDQQKCIEAGANDYISKPLDVEMLLSLCRVWIGK